MKLPTGAGLLMATVLFFAQVSLAQTEDLSKAMALVNREKQGWETWKNNRFTEADILQMFSSDMNGVDPISGQRYDRAKAMEGARRQKVGRYTLSDFKVEILSPVLARMRFRATYELIVNKRTVLIDGFINATYRLNSKGWEIVGVSKDLLE